MRIKKGVLTFAMLSIILLSGIISTSSLQNRVYGKENPAYVSVVSFMTAALLKIKAHKDSPEQVHLDIKLLKEGLQKILSNATK